ncbi:hypothetical protein K443DRAFT_9270 [Laccaria amethystina LaAM-08-1]|uniref:Uncharacterized protein n=1 Tax=Laccaria amethystina LaAM-08-1 TaxID=1095629 RepID=A0A0C9WZK0_9AGAR|nr:hypothetical protein K443DRAFT_9270 [Laccaria amethystina LaAM-08-1]
MLQYLPKPRGLQTTPPSDSSPFRNIVTQKHPYPLATFLITQEISTVTAQRWAMISSLPHSVELATACIYGRVLDTPLDVDWTSNGIIRLEHPATEITIRGRSFTVFGSPHTLKFWDMGVPATSSTPSSPSYVLIVWTTFGHLDAVRSKHAVCPELLKRLRAAKHALYATGYREESVGSDDEMTRILVGLLVGSLPRTVTALATPDARSTVPLNTSIRPGHHRAFLNNGHFGIRVKSESYIHIGSLMMFVTSST